MAVRFISWTRARTLARPGPRIVNSLEILGGILHPRQFPEFASAGADDPRVVRAGETNLL